MNNFKYIAGVLLMGLLSGSCSDFLSEEPDSRTQLDSPEKIRELLVNAYPSASYFVFTELMSDNVGDSRRTDNDALDTRTYYLWGDERQESIDSPAEFWESSYSAIAHANQALKAIEELGSPSSTDPQKGEALLARAYNHFMLLNVFAEAYDPSTASDKMGIPYMDKVEENLLVYYKRNSIEEVYDMVESDIIEGLKLVSNKYKQPKYHFTPEAGRALAVRFYTYKGDWDKVLEYSEYLGDFPVEKLRDYSNYSGLAFEEQGQLYGSAKENANLLIAGQRTRLEYKFLGFASSSRFGLSYDQAMEMLRNNPYNRAWGYTIIGAGNDVYMYTKFFEYFYYTNQSAGIGQPYVNVVLLGNDETYLSRIEATAMKGDYDKAVKMIAHFVKYKTLGFVEGSESTVTLQTILNLVPNADDLDPYYGFSDNTQARLVKYVAELRRREMGQEGARWFDNKRFNMEIVHRMLIEGTEHILTSKDPRKAVQVPSSVLNYGIEPNPRN